MTALLIGTALAVASLLFVIYPLLRAELPGAAVLRQSSDPRPRQSSAVEALRELEFDRETGKISDSDYEPLKARYTKQALAVMRAGDAAVCERCGPRPERDAEYCSKCGAALVH
jgi:ribosomal protein L40E